LDKQPRILLVRPTHFPNGGGWVMSGERMLGQNASIGTMFTVAFETPAIRSVFPPDLPKENYDFLVNLPSDGRAEFKEQLKKQFGLTARYEVRAMDAMILKLKTANASGLKISQEQNGGTSSGPGSYSMRNQPLGSLISYLEQTLKLPIVDQTGLRGRYDIELKWAGNDTLPQIEPLKKALLDQIGLELVPSIERINMLIVERAKN
jgi:uncharacterized protein (TIGR03435 family)